MSLIITPEQYAAELAQKGQALPPSLQPRWFDTYDDDIMGEPLSEGLEDAVREYESRDPVESNSAESKETLARLKEENSAAVKQFKFLDPKDYEDEQARVGRVMSAADFLNKLRNECHLRCWYGDPVKGYMALRVARSDGGEREYATWVSPGNMPEFEMMWFDDHGVVKNTKRRGWRSALLNLIIKGFVSEEVATKVFGQATGKASVRYNMQLDGFRNRPRKGE